MSKAAAAWCGIGGTAAGSQEAAGGVHGGVGLDVLIRTREAAS